MLTQSEPIEIKEPVIIQSPFGQTFIQRSGVAAAALLFNMDVNGIQGVSFVSGFDISGFTSGIVVSNLRSGDSLSVTGNTLRNNTNNGIEILEHDYSIIEISNNQIYGNTRGVYAHPASGTNEFLGNLNIISSISGGRNYIHDNSIAGVDVSGYGTNASNTHRITIGNSYIYANGASDPNGAGVRIVNAHAALTIAQNIIGLNSSGTAQPNRVGVRIGGNVVTTASSIDHNTISGNIDDGLVIASSELTNLSIENNNTGLLEVSGSYYSKPNGGSGIYIGSSKVKNISSNNIGTNGNHGIVLSGSGTTGIDIASNQILLNGGDGIAIDSGASGFEIDSNSFTSNSGAGMRLANSAGNGTSMLFNSFLGNGGLAIELATTAGNGPNPNDLEDLDNGPNKLLNYPQLVTSSFNASGKWELAYDLDVDKPGAYYVNLYVYTAATKSYVPLATPQNPAYPGSFPDAADAAEPGILRFIAELPTSFGLSAGQAIVATLTGLTGDNTGNTSEFSPPLTLVNGPPRVVDVRVDNLTLTSGVITRNWGRAPFSYSAIVPTGKQLAPLFTQGANAIQIQFSEHVNVSATSLKLYRTGAKNGAPAGTPLDQALTVVSPLAGAAGFDYDSVTHVATWVFAALPADKYRIVLDETSVTDSSNRRLDGEWSNLTNDSPDNFADDPTGRTFVSGNGTAGGAFWFFFSYLPGDYNQDGAVTLPRACHCSAAMGKCEYLLAA